MGRPDRAGWFPEHQGPRRTGRTPLPIAAVHHRSDRGQPLPEQFKGKLDDQAFALELLENKHVLVAPGSSFNTTYTDHFRITTLPDTDTLDTVFDRIDELLAQHA